MKKIILLALFITSQTITVKAQYTKLLDFDLTNGWGPFGSLFSDGTFLYGMTASGGTTFPYNMGVVFKIKPDGTAYSKLLDFDGTNGSTPYGSLISDGIFLYGMTETGGINNKGIIFKIMPDGTGYSKLFDFDSINGESPTGSLIFEGPFLYGMAKGGTNNAGVIFKIMPDGTGYSKLLDFNGANGSFTYGSLISDGIFLYGTTLQGGTDSSGTIFKIKLDGTAYAKLLDFTGGANGNLPHGDLISDGTFLYGTTHGGGTDSLGTIFKIKTDGTGYAKLLDFNGTNGSYPFCSLISDDTFLYGMTSGGINIGGTVFKINADGTGYTKLLEFLGPNGNFPLGSLISDGIFLYGMTNDGGSSSKGVIFKNCLAHYTTAYDSVQNIFTLNIDSTITNLATTYYWDFGDGTSSNLASPSHTYTADTIYNVCMKIYLASGDSCIYCHEIGKDYLGNIYRNPGFTINVQHGNVTAGISQNQKDKNTIAVFPNPTSGAFTIIAQENQYTLIVTNVLGEIIYKSEIQNMKTEIDFNKQSNGIYFLNIKTAHGIVSKKLIINK